MRKLFLAAIISLACILGLTAQTRDNRSWTKDCRLEPDELISIGRNPYFILEPGYVLVLEAGNERLTITVLNETRRIDNVETRIVEERETDNGRPAEISRNYFAISKRTNNVLLLRRGCGHVQ